MTLRRFGLGFSDPNPGKAKQDRDMEAAIQDLQGVEVEVTTPGANVEFAVPHKLRDQIPRAVVVLRSDKGSVIYSSRRVDWTTSRIFVKSTVANDTVLLWLR